MAMLTSLELSLLLSPVSGAAWPSIWQLYTRPGQVYVHMCACVSVSVGARVPEFGMREHLEVLPCLRVLRLTLGNGLNKSGCCAPLALFISSLRCLDEALCLPRRDG